MWRGSLHLRHLRPLTSNLLRRLHSPSPPTITRPPVTNSNPLPNTAVTQRFQPRRSSPQHYNYVTNEHPGVGVGSQSVYRHGSPLTRMLTKARELSGAEDRHKGRKEAGAERETAAPDHKTLPFNSSLSRHDYNIRADRFISRA